MYVVANHVLPEAEAPKKNDGAVQLDLFTDYAAEEEKQKADVIRKGQRPAVLRGVGVMQTVMAVSYTHLDVYKRQSRLRSLPSR